MALPDAVWLRRAQGLAIGGSIRVAHQGDRTNRPNLLISNHPDRWSAYCMSCKTGAVSYKTHVRVTGVPVPAKSHDISLPTDMVKVIDLGPTMQNAVLDFLATKNMDLFHFPDLSVFFSDERKRLLVPTPQGWLGRDTTGNSPQKWLTYNRSQYLGCTRIQNSIAVVVEDPFSYFKVKWAIHKDVAFNDYTIFCALGTGIRNALVLQLILSRRATFFFDGDGPGVSGAKQAARRIASLDVPASAACAPTGFDPKDLTGEEIRDHLRRYCG